MALSIVGQSFWCRHWKAKNYISLKLTAHSLREFSTWNRATWQDGGMARKDPFCGGGPRSCAPFHGSWDERHGRSSPRPRLLPQGTGCWRSRPGHKFPFLLLLRCDRVFWRPVLGLTAGPRLSLASSTARRLCRGLNPRGEPPKLNTEPHPTTYTVPEDHVHCTWGPINKSSCFLFL